MSLRRSLEVLGLAAGLFFLAGCGDRPHPKDAEMLDNFARHEKGFEELATMVRADKGLVRVDADWTDPANPSTVGVGPERIAEYRRKFKELEVPRGFRVVRNPETITFLANGIGLGISGSGKGYVYTERTPDLIVKELDGYKSPDGRSFTACRPIKGNWYLYYDYED